MQIGYGQNGVRIGEYELVKNGNKHQEHYNAKPEKADTNPVIGWIEPNCENPKWIMWFMDNGDAVVYADRYDDGAVIGEPIRLKARG